MMLIAIKFSIKSVSTKSALIIEMVIFFLSNFLKSFAPQGLYPLLTLGCGKCIKSVNKRGF